MYSKTLPTIVRAYPAQPATAFWRAIEIDAIVKHGLPGGTGLDLGCGDGKLTAIILEQTGPRDMIGIDPDPLETAAAEASGLYTTVQTTPGSNIDAPDGAFDFALSNSVLEHIPELEPVIAETARVLRPGGVFVLTVPAPAFRTNLGGSILPWISRDAYLEALDRRVAHVNYLDRAGWNALLGRHGFSIATAFGYLDRRETRRWETLSRMTGGLLSVITGGRARPIEIQRKMGLRQLQNRRGLPAPLTRLISWISGFGHGTTPAYWHTDDGLPDEEAGCLLIVATRT